MTNTIGIDLGTSQSSGYYNKGINEKGQVKFHEILNDKTRAGETRAKNEKGFPSYVKYDYTGEAEVAGENARTLAYNNPKNTIYDSKRIIGRRYNDKNVQRFKKILEERGHYEICEDNGQVKIKMGNITISPEEVASEIIIEVVKNAFQQDNALEIGKMVVSVPAYFDHDQRTQTKKAAVLAIKRLREKYPEKITIEVENEHPEEIKGVELISEPSAAFMTYNEKKGLEGITEDKYILVFDLGAGTLDITIGKRKQIKDPFGNLKVLLDVKTIHGNTSLGGRDMDTLIMEWVKEDLQKRKNTVTSDKNLSYELNKELNIQVEKAKIRLSTKENTTIKLPDLIIEIPLSRAKLEEIVDPVVEDCKKEINTAMEKAGIEQSEIDNIVMVGGPTFMPVIRTAVAKLVGTEIKEVPGWNPMLSVSEGAARSAIGTFDPDPSPFDYHIAAGRFNKIVASKIVTQGDKLPIAIKQTIELPFVSTGRPEEVEFYIIESKHGSEKIIENKFQKVKLSIVGEGDKTEVIKVQSDFFGTLVDFPVCYKKIEMTGDITKEHLIKNPVIEGVSWPDLPFSEAGAGFVMMETMEFEKNMKELLTEFIHNKDVELDQYFERNYSELIITIMKSNGCSREVAKRTLYINLVRPPPSDFNSLRTAVAEKIKQAEEMGISQDLINKWKKQYGPANKPTNKNIALLNNIYQAIEKAIMLR